MTMIEGFTQAIRHGAADQRLHFKIRHEGKEATPDTPPTVTIYDPAGTELLPATALTAVPASGWWYVDVDATGTTSWVKAFNYRAEINFAVDAIPVQDNAIIDVVAWPFNEPLITTEEIDRLHPSWAGKRPKDWLDWTEPIDAAHLRVSKDLRNLQDSHGRYVYPATIIDRGQVRMIAMAYTLEQIAESIRMKEEVIERYNLRSISALQDFNRFLVDLDQDMIPDDDDGILTGPTFSH